MLITSLFSWWYTAGWQWRLKRGREILRSQIASFAPLQLLKTLFAPYRQTYAHQPRNAPINIRAKAMVSRFVSRLVGFFVRIGLLLAVLLSLTAILLVQIAVLLVWPLVPFLPIIGIVLSIGGF